MAQSKRAWIIGGVVLLQLMLLVAVFALGVYMGRYGLTREGLVYAGPGRVQGAPQGGVDRPPGQQLPQGQPGGQLQLPPGLGEPPQLTGRVLRIAPDALNVATPQGPRPVLLDGETAYRDFEGAELGLRDLTPGMIVAVYGELDPATRNLHAAEIVVLPPALREGEPPAAQP